MSGHDHTGPEPCPWGCPHWEQLPQQAATALQGAGFDAVWYAAATPALRLTVLNVFAKLSALGLWQFVAENADSSEGCLNFRTSDIEGLLAAIARHDGLTRPMHTGKRWHARETRTFGSLHFKHFDGWPEDRVQAHIDRTGTHYPWWAWALPIVGLVLLVLHALQYNSYRDTRSLRKQLLRQRVADPALLGTEPS